MNMDRIIGMVANQVIRRVVNLVVDRGFNFVSRKSADLTASNADDALPKLPKSKEELARDAQLRSMADQAANTAKVTRRLRRF